MPQQLRSRSSALLFASLLACNLIDDDEPPTTAGGDDTGGAPDCLNAAAEHQPECAALGQTWYAEWNGGGASMLLIDDPSVNLGVGPNAWLIQVSSSADYIGNYNYDGDTCSVGCAFCEQGQSLCHAGLNDEGAPVCPLCLPSGTENPGQQCAAFVDACLGGLSTSAGSASADGGLDETGGGEDGLDETGGDVGGVVEYDCSSWDPAGAATIDPKTGVVTLDAAVVEEIAVTYGNPLACDGTLFALTANGTFAIRQTAPNGVLAQMGLQAGDEIRAANGVPMDTLDAVSDMTLDLFYGSRLPSFFTLTTIRGRETKEITILIR